MAITKTDIHATADKLAAEGTAPTLAAIRSALGGGSFTTISEAMKEWKASQQASAAPIRETAPAAIAERMADAAAEAWAVALEMANDRLRSEREALDVARLEMEQSKSEAAELADQLAADLEAAQAIIEQQRQALASAEAQAGQQAAKGAELVQRLAEQTDAAHSAAAALAETRGRIEQITAMLVQERTERAAAQKQASAAEQAAAVLTARLESAEQARAKAEKNEAQARAEAQKLGERTAALGAELKAAERRAIEAQDREKTAALMLADARKQALKTAEPKSKSKPV